MKTAMTAVEKLHEETATKLNTDLGQAYKDALHDLIDQVYDVKVLEYLFHFDFQYIATYCYEEGEEDD